MALNSGPRRSLGLAGAWLWHQTVRQTTLNSAFIVLFWEEIRKCHNWYSSLSWFSNSSSWASPHLRRRFPVYLHSHLIWRPLFRPPCNWVFFVNRNFLMTRKVKCALQRRSGVTGQLGNRQEQTRASPWLFFNKLLFGMEYCFALLWSLLASKFVSRSKLIGEERSQATSEQSKPHKG